MEVAFKKIPASGINFEATNGNVKFSGVAKKDSKDLVHCFGRLSGKIIHNCDRCADEFSLEIDEEVNLFVSDGIYEDEENLLEVVESFDGFVNFDTILESELGLVMSDYHYCPTCKENN